MLLRSWIAETALADRTGWVAIGRGEQDPQQFWLSVLGTLRQTAPGPVLIRELTAAPDLDGWAIVERLLKDLAPLKEQLWLVIDDLHELVSDQARRQLELLMMRAPQELRFVLAGRQDVQLGLHRLRLEGDLTEIRANDLRFSLAEARELFDAAGVELPGPALEMLHDRTEGWVAGLRLAALSLAAHPDPERFAAEFSGTERTVAEYLLAEVLERQDEQVRRLLLRTSVLDRVNGELADLLTGESGGERVLQDLEDANAFVVSLDAARSWFRYHHLFGDLLQLELRRAQPAEVTLHQHAAGWLAGHGYPVEAVRQAQAARDWGLAVRLLADHWLALYLSGQAATVHALLASFPAGAAMDDAELAGLAAADEQARGSLEAAERYLRLAERGLASAPDGRRAQAEVLLTVVRLQLAWYRGDHSAGPEQARQLQALAEASGAAQPGLGDELRAFALIGLGNAETWTGPREQVESLLKQGIELARRSEPAISRVPGPDLPGGYRALPVVSAGGGLQQAGNRASRAARLDRRSGHRPRLHGTRIRAGVAGTRQRSGYLVAARRADGQTGNLSRGGDGNPLRPRPARAGPRRAGAADALAAFRAAERLAGPHPLARPLRGWLVRALARLGETERAEQILAGLSQRARDRGEMRIAAAVLRLATDGPRAASVTLAPVLDGSAQVGWRSWLAEAFLLEAIARDALGDPAAAGHALERALDFAEPDGAFLWFLIHPAPGLLERLARQRTGHAALAAQILGLLAGRTPAPPSAEPRPPLEPLSGSGSACCATCRPT